MSLQLYLYKPVDLFHRPVHLLRNSAALLLRQLECDPGVVRAATAHASVIRGNHGIVHTTFLAIALVRFAECAPIVIPPRYPNIRKCVYHIIYKSDMMHLPLNVNVCKYKDRQRQF